MITDINSEDRLVQETFATYLQNQLGWESLYAFNQETFGPNGTLGRFSERDVVLERDLRAALERLNPLLPPDAIEQAVDKLTRIDFARSLIQHNRDFYSLLRDGVPIEYRDTQGELQRPRARVIDFANGSTNGVQNNRFLAVRELKIQGLNTPHYNRRADLVCYVNGLPFVFIELKAVYHNLRQGFDNNLTDYITQSIPHAFHHNAFLIVSNGDAAQYGSITSTWEHFNEWKRNTEDDAGRVDAETLLQGLLEPNRLLDFVENFILFDDSKPGGTRKVVARNHQVLGVNNAFENVRHQEELKKQFPPDQRLAYSLSQAPIPEMADDVPETKPSKPELPLIERAHPDLGRLGVFWHTQGSGKSYSMAFFTEKVRRHIESNFTFLLLTDREDLDDQIYTTFTGTGVADENTPRASSGEELQKLLQDNPRYVFSLVHKFNQDVSLDAPYNKSDSIIVISDEAHRTQSGKFARNMRMALPNASFLGFTGTPLFKQDHLTRRIFGEYVSRYDFQRSVEDRSTVKLVYENRGEDLGIASVGLNERIAERIEQSDLDPDELVSLNQVLGKDYAILTADDRLDKIAHDFVDHCTMRWMSGKFMLVCLDKLTTAKMHQRIIPEWQAKIDEVNAEIVQLEANLAATTDSDDWERLDNQLQFLRGQSDWMQNTLIEIVISESQNEVKDFQEKADGFDIRPHREVMKRGFETADGKRTNVEDAFKDPKHPFRVAIVCAMWLTGFDVESLSTMYIDKPMKAHTLMQAIARANRVYPGKDCGVIVDYNGLLKSLRAALAQYAVGDGVTAGQTEIVAPIAERVADLEQAIVEAENYLRTLGFDPARFDVAKGFDRIEAFKDAVAAVLSSDDTKRRFQIMVSQVVARFRALITEPAVFQYAARRDNLEIISKKLNDQRDLTNVNELLQELYQIVNEAIRTQDAGQDQKESIQVDLSTLDFAKLQQEFATKARRKTIALQDLRDIIEQRMAQMLQNNPSRMDYYRRYQEIVAAYNREKDRATVEATFAELVNFVNDLDEEQQRAAREGLTEDELALFDLLSQDTLTKTDREKLKQASKELLASLRALIDPMPAWANNAYTRADVEGSISDWVLLNFPIPPYTIAETQAASQKLYNFVFQQSFSGRFGRLAVAV